MITLSGIDWGEFKQLLDSKYKNFDKHRHIYSIKLMGRIYDRYQKGERSISLYLDFMDLIGD
jgi:hypothetical protein